MFSPLTGDQGLEDNGVNGSGLSVYDSTSKRDWRGWIWNRIVQTLPEWRGTGKVPKNGSAAQRQVTRDKNVLYLVGPEDLDREFAMARGFANKNLVAVEADRLRCNMLRRLGHVVFYGTMQDALSVKQESLRFDVVVFDGCGGLNREAEELMVRLFWCSAVTERTVVCVNFQRGRDAYSNAKREKLVSAMEKNPEWVLVCEWMRKRHKLFDWKKHRGVHWFWQCMATACCIFKEHGYDVHLGRFAADMYPVFTSYRGSRVVMDTAVFGWPIGHQAHISKPVEASRRQWAAYRAVLSRKLTSRGHEGRGMQAQDEVAKTAERRQVEERRG